MGKCNHEWEEIVGNRTREDVNYGCPYCSHKRVLKGFNDLWTTAPEVAKLLKNWEDGYLYRKFSEQRVDWKCPSCETIIKNKAIHTISQRGLSCPKCSDGISYPEKIMFHFLSDNNIQFDREKVFDWLPDKRYDFFIPKWNMIIEMHGEQHYIESNFSKSNNQTLQNIQENDNLKAQYAIKNNIECYVVIDCRHSDIDFIVAQINSSILHAYANTQLNWNDIDLKSRKSFVREAVDLYEKGMDKQNIAKKLGIHVKTVHRYLKKSGALEREKI